ncbi:hypothetical protein ACQP26_11750 [Micromonospora sp. CA-248089]|uniref:hypothetical protein n=1 Tax=Micromonospora sp. CA-248089 TaxID=3239960 RepID=UPI003D8D3075
MRRPGAPGPAAPPVRPGGPETGAPHRGADGPWPGGPEAGAPRRPVDGPWPGVPEAPRPPDAPYRRRTDGPTGQQPPVTGTRVPSGPPSPGRAAVDPGRPAVDGDTRVPPTPRGRHGAAGPEGPHPVDPTVPPQPGGRRARPDDTAGIQPVSGGARRARTDDTGAVVPMPGERAGRGPTTWHPAPGRSRGRAAGPVPTTFRPAPGRSPAPAVAPRRTVPLPYRAAETRRTCPVRPCPAGRRPASRPAVVVRPATGVPT